MQTTPVSSALLSALVAWGLSSATPAQAIVGGTATTAFGAVSAGVQIAPNWVLTANHVGLTVGNVYSNGYGSSQISATYSASGAAFPSDDLKLLRLNSALAGTPAMSLSSTVYGPTAMDFLNPAFSLPVTMVSGSNHSPRGYAWAQMRDAVDLVAEDHDNNPLTPDVIYSLNWLVVYSDTFGAPYVQGGDSGGALFWGHATDANTPLMGITSALLSQLPTPGSTGYGSAYVSVAAYRGWIDSTMGADLADSQVANWVSTATPVPEPTTALLWLAGAAALSARARKHRKAGATR